MLKIAQNVETLLRRYGLFDDTDSSSSRGSDPKIGVIIPAYNEADNIETVLESVCENGYNGRISVYLIANGCTDGTAEIARKYAKSASYPIEVIELGEANISDAINVGIELAEKDGVEVAYFSDADTLLEKGVFEKVGRAVRKGYVAGEVECRPDTDGFWERLYYGVSNLYKGITTPLGNFMDFPVMGTGASMFARMDKVRELEIENGHFFDPAKMANEDTEAFRALGESGSLAYIKTKKVITSSRRVRGRPLAFVERLIDNLNPNGVYYPNIRNGALEVAV